MVSWRFWFLQILVLRGIRTNPMLSLRKLLITYWGLLIQFLQKHHIYQRMVWSGVTVVEKISIEFGVWVVEYISIKFGDAENISIKFEVWAVEINIMISRVNSNDKLWGSSRSKLFLTLLLTVICVKNRVANQQ